ERGDLVGGDAHIDVEEGLLGSVKEIDLGDAHAHGESCRGFLRRCACDNGWKVHRKCLPHRSVHRLRPRNSNAPGKNRPGDDVNYQNQAEQNKPRSPSLTVPIIIRGEGISIDHHREGSGGLSPAGAPELIAKSGEEEGGGFTGDAGESQEDGSEDAAIGGRDDDGGDGFPFAGAESHSAFAKSAGNTAKKFLGAAKGDGNHHQAKSETAGESGVLPEGVNDKAVSKNADDDGGHAVEEIRGIAND